MAELIIHQDKIPDNQELIKLCPFGAMEEKDGKVTISAACKMCRLCVRKGPKGAVEYVEDAVKPSIDKSAWKGIAVYVDHVDGKVHPVTLELLGKARELSKVTGHPVYALFMGNGIEAAAHELLHYNVDKVFVYDAPELARFQIEPYTAVFENFIQTVKPSSILVGATTVGRQLAPRVAARMKTGLTADCTILEMDENTDLSQIRPAFGGNIMAHSNEKGTTFTVTLPKRDISQYHPSVPALAADEKEISSTLVDAEIQAGDEALEGDCPIVLVIDDNADIRHYVKSLLVKEFRVLDASDGATGIRLAMKYVPDVIVSDVMMPGMDGIECCRRLKGELQTCHIPVILLTACSLDEQRIQGYDGGADSYISKPFNSQLLLSRIRNLIANHKQLKQFFGDNQSIEKESVSELDKDFVTRFKTLVGEKMKDPELNVEDLGRDMGMSRVQLYRKLKSLTNYSPNELLRRMRLKKAASLLAASDMTVAEIAYEVGFSSPSYFTKCYKEQFGESPTDFLKRKG